MPRGCRCDSYGNSLANAGAAGAPVYHLAHRFAAIPIAYSRLAGDAAAMSLSPSESAVTFGERWRVPLPRLLLGIWRRVRGDVSD